MDSITIIPDDLTIERDKAAPKPELPGVYLLCYETDGSSVVTTTDHDGIYTLDVAVERDYFKEAALYPSIYHWLLTKTIED